MPAPPRLQTERDRLNQTHITNYITHDRLAERVGFEPTTAFAVHDFQSCSMGGSTPQGTRLLIM